MLDFSKLGPLPENDAPKCPENEFKDAPNSLIPAKEEKPVAAKPDAIAQEKPKTKEELSNLQAGKLLQQNIMKGECAIWAINHALNNGRPPVEVALIATKGLAYVTGDPMIYKKISEQYRKQYGVAMKDFPSYEIQYQDET